MSNGILLAKLPKEHYLKYLTKMFYSAKSLDFSFLSCFPKIRIAWHLKLIWSSPIALSPICTMYNLALILVLIQTTLIEDPRH